MFQNNSTRRLPRKNRERSRRRFWLECLENRLVPAPVAWIADAGGAWDDGSKWSTGSVPGPDDDVTIDRAAGNFTITLGGGTHTVKSLSVPGDETLAMSGGSLTLLEPSAVAMLNLTGGTLTANAQLTLTGTSTLANGASVLAGTVRNEGTLSMTAGDPDLDGTLNNAGTIISSGARLDLVGGGQLVNLASGVFDIAVASHGENFHNFGGTIENAGTLRHSGAGNGSIGGVTFNNAGGTIDVTDGSFNVNGSGTFTGGTFTVAAGKALYLGGGTKTISGTLTGSGGGAVGFFDGTLSAAASGATLNFPSGLFHSIAEPSGVFGGNPILDGGTFTNTGFIQFSSGQPDLNTTLNNSGTIINTGARFDLLGSGHLVNLASGVFDIAVVSHGENFHNFGGTIENSGTLRHSGTGNGSLGGVTFNNAGGTIDVTGGSFDVNGSGTFTGGTFTVAAGKAMYLSAGTKTVSGTLTGSGGGVVSLSSGTLSAAAGGATLDFPAGMFHYVGSGNLGGGTFTNTGFIQMDGGQPDLSTTLNNSGTIIKLARLALLGGGHLVNLAGGLFDIATSNINGVFVNGGGTIENAGTFRYSAGGFPNDLSGISFSNTGIVEVTAGSFALNGPVAQVSGQTLTGGTCEVHPVTRIGITGTALTTNNGTIILHGNGSIGGVTGALETNNGSLELLEGADFNVTMSFANIGSLVLSPGSVMNVPLEFTQGPNGRTEFQIGGTPASGQFGQLATAANTSLDGTAALAIVNGFSLGTGQQYTLMTFPSRTSQFDAIDGVFLQRTRMFDPVLTDTQLLVNTVADAADLDVNITSTPAIGTSGQDVTINWTVTNVGINPTFTNAWTDSVFLSLDNALDQSDKLVGHMPHSGALVPLAFYNGSLTAPLPGVVPGEYRFLVVADSQGQMPDIDRSDNTDPSMLITTDITALAPGVPFSGTIASGQDVWFRVDLPFGRSPNFHATYAQAGEAELYTRQGDVPDRATFDHLAFSPTLASADITAFSGRAGTFYVLLHGRESAGTGQNFTLTATGLPFGASSLSVTAGANAGRVTTIVSGSLFTPDTEFSLVPVAGAPIAAASTTFIDPATAWVTFDLTGRTPGSYGLMADDGASTATLAGAFQVNTGPAGHFTYSFDAPRFVRPPFRGVFVTLNYANTGGTDIMAPLLTVSSDNGLFRVLGSSDFIFDAVEVLAINDEGPAGVLPPGARSQIQIAFKPETIGAHFVSELVAQISGPPDNVIGWDVLKSALEPETVNDTAWDTIFANFTAQAGSTVAGYNAVLADNATYLSRFGDYTPSTGRLLSFEFQQADNFGEISARGHLDGFGRGRIAPFSMHAITVDGGDVIVAQGSEVRVFGMLEDGSFRGTGDDTGVLTKDGAGAVHLRDKTGFETVFRASDGKFDYLQDPNGNRITATYNAGGQLTSVVATNGDTATFTYNAAGRIDSITDAVGRVTTYTYDATGEHLMSFTNAAGTTSFTYVTAAGPAQHAIASATLPDGSQFFNSYDAQGRFAGQTRNGGALPLTFAYDSTGGVTRTDAQGHVTQFFRGDGGEFTRVIDPLGNVTEFLLDAFGRRTGIVARDGATATLMLDAARNPTSLTDPLGHTTVFDVDGSIARLQSLVDPRGNTTEFGYDARGNLTGVTDAAGGTDSFSYDAHGNTTQSVNENGQLVAYTYESRDVLIRKDFPGGAHTDYTYDPHRNLLTASDAEGTTSFTYDAADRVTHVAYPNGKSLDYTYDTQGRLATVADPSGFTVRYHYDALSRLDHVGDTGDATLVQYAYDSVGQLATETRANGTTTAYTYDAAGRVATITHRNPDNSVAASFAYSFDAVGRVTQVVTLAGTTSYLYDLNGQFTSVALPGGRTITYQYDAAGNRVAVNDSASGVTSYTAGALNQYTAAGAATFGYDPAGNLVSRIDGSGTTSFSFDIEGRIIGAFASFGALGYDYDALGNQIAVIRDGQRTDFALDPLAPGGLTQVFGEYDNAGSLVAHYAYGRGLAGRVDAGGQAAFYHFDSTGNTAIVTGAAGAVLDSYTYLPFGEKLTATGTTPNPFTFNGAFGIRDDGGNLYSMRAREYDAALGRFIQEDPIGFGGGDMNLYRFVGNNPVSLVDPSGLQEDLNAIPGDVGPEGLEGQKGARAALLYTSFTDAKRPKVTKIGGLNTGIIVTQREEAEEIANEQYPDLPNAQGAKPVALVSSVGLKDPWDPKYRGPTEMDDYPPAFRPLEWVEYLHYVARRIHKNPSDLTKDERSEIFRSYNVYIQNFDFDLAEKYQYLEQILPHDPNNIIGPAGFGADAILDTASQPTRFDGFVRGDDPLGYTVLFENQASAGAAAQNVTITETLDPTLDLSTFQLGSFGFGGMTFDVPAGRSSYSTRLDLSGTLGIFVDVDAILNFSTRQLTFMFTTLDAQTGDLPLDPFAGFLPPNVTPPEGDGFITYSVNALPGLASGTEINAQASIVFDTEAPIDTPLIHNTVDTLAPTSSVTPFSSPTSSSPDFTVAWTGADNAGGSGVAFYHVFVSDNGGPFTTWLSGVSATSAIFTGEVGHSYGFYSVATDQVDFREAAAMQADAEVNVVTNPPTIENFAVPVGGRNKLRGVTLTFSEPLNAGTATERANYRVTTAGKDNRLGTADDKAVKLAQAAYNAGQLQVQVSFAKRLDSDAAFQITVDGTPGITDEAGLSLDGDRSGAAGGDYVALVGAKFSYVDHDGDAVSLSLSKGGRMWLTRQPDGDGRDLTVGLGGTVTKRTILSGSVKPPRSGGTDRCTDIASIQGLAVGLNALPACTPTQPGFRVVATSGVLVDELLASDSLSRWDWAQILEMLKREYEIVRFR